LFAISVEVFLSERLFRAAKKSSHRGRIQIESGRHFIVCEAVAAQEQQFGVAMLDDASTNRTFSCSSLEARISSGVGTVRRNLKRLS
jgi:hypothetical protein